MLGPEQGSKLQTARGERKGEGLHDKSASGSLGGWEHGIAATMLGPH